MKNGGREKGRSEASGGRPKTSKQPGFIGVLKTPAEGERTPEGLELRGPLRKGAQALANIAQAC